jgi:uncharacterized protein YycO
MLVRAAIKPLGALSGHVTWRFGRKFGVSKIDVESLLKLARPGDVILTHTKYSLANSLIPGKWDHAALVYKEDLVIQATTHGVGVAGFSRLCTGVDAVCLLRPMFATEGQRSQAVMNALSQVGKPYDFDFEYRLDGGNSFYCSELVWWSYDVALQPAVAPFKPDFVLGRWTLAPQSIRDSEYWTKIYETGDSPALEA